MAARKNPPAAPQVPQSKPDTVNVLMAIDWLATQVVNRPVSRVTVRRYAREMLAGRWALNGDPIRFDWDGHLIDGQHRLEALVLAGEVDEEITINVFVVRGLDPAAQMTMDQGRRRDAGQQLDMLNLLNSRGPHGGGGFIAAVARLVVPFELDEEPGAIASMSNLAVVEWVEAHLDEVRWIVPYREKLRGYAIRPAVLGAILLLFHRKAPAAAGEFVESFVTGANLPQGSPVLALRQRLHVANRVHENIPDKLGMYYLMQAWNAWIKGRTLTKMQRPAGEGYRPEHFVIRP